MPKARVTNIDLGTDGATPPTIPGTGVRGFLRSIYDALVFRFGGGKAAYVSTINTSGNHDAITPGAGLRVRVFWVAFIPNSDNSASNRVNLGFGATGGAITTSLYRATAMAHWEVFTGAPDEVFIINTQTAEPVDFTVHYAVL